MIRLTKAAELQCRFRDEKRSQTMKVRNVCKAYWGRGARYHEFAALCPPHYLDERVRGEGEDDSAMDPHY